METKPWVDIADFIKAMEVAVRLWGEDGKRKPRAPDASEFAPDPKPVWKPKRKQPQSAGGVQ
jgi:hypothetical protein